MKSISIKTDSSVADARMLMVEIEKMIIEQNEDHICVSKHIDTTKDNIKGDVFAEIIITFLTEVGKDLAVSFLVYLTKEAIKKLFPPDQRKKIEVNEEEQRITVQGIGDEGDCSITIDINNK